MAASSSRSFICSACARALHLSRRPHILRQPAIPSQRSLATPAYYRARTSSRLSFTTPLSTIRPLATSTNTHSHPSSSATASSPLSPPSPPSLSPATVLHLPTSLRSSPPPKLTITPRAASRLAALSSAEHDPNLALRVAVESGGCHGFQYTMGLVSLGAGLGGSEGGGTAEVVGEGTETETKTRMEMGEHMDAVADDARIGSPYDAQAVETRMAGSALAGVPASAFTSGASPSETSPAATTAATPPPPAEGDPSEDVLFRGLGGALVVVDAASLELLAGATVDYATELIGSQFVVVDIPGASSSCGCGTSFDVKF